MKRFSFEKVIDALDSNHLNREKATQGLSLHLGSSGSPKTALKNISFKSVLLLPPAAPTNTFHSTNLFLICFVLFFSRHYVPTNSLVRSFCIHA